MNKFRGGINADSRAPACRFRFLRSVVSEFLTTHFSDKLKFPFWAGTGKALENLRFSVVPHLFLKVIPGVRTFSVPRAPITTSCCFHGQKPRMIRDGKGHRTSRKLVKRDSYAH